MTQFILLLALWLPDNQVRIVGQLSETPLSLHGCIEAVNNPVVRGSYLVDAVEKAGKGTDGGEYLLLCSPIRDDSRKADK